MIIFVQNQFCLVKMLAHLKYQIISLHHKVSPHSFFCESLYVCLGFQVPTGHCCASPAAMARTRFSRSADHTALTMKTSCRDWLHWVRRTDRQTVTYKDHRMQHRYIDHLTCVWCTSSVEMYFCTVNLLFGFIFPDLSQLLLF